MTRHHTHHRRWKWTLITLLAVTAVLAVAQSAWLWWGQPSMSAELAVQQFADSDTNAAVMRTHEYVKNVLTAATNLLVLVTVAAFMASPASRRGFERIRRAVARRRRRSDAAAHGH